MLGPVPPAAPSPPLPASVGALATVLIIGAPKCGTGLVAGKAVAGAVGCVLARGRRSLRSGSSTWPRAVASRLSVAGSRKRQRSRSVAGRRGAGGRCWLAGRGGAGGKANGEGLGSNAELACGSCVAGEMLSEGGVGPKLVRGRASGASPAAAEKGEGCCSVSAPDAAAEQDGCAAAAAEAAAAPGPAWGPAAAAPPQHGCLRPPAVSLTPLLLPPLLMSLLVLLPLSLLLLLVLSPPGPPLLIPSQLAPSPTSSSASPPAASAPRGTAPPGRPSTWPRRPPGHRCDSAPPVPLQDSAAPAAGSLAAALAAPTPCCCC